MKNRTWILIFAAIFLICAAILIFVPRGGSENIVEIRCDGEVIERIDLGKVKEPYEKTLELGGGFNRLRVTGETVEVIAADCPTKTCVAHGPLEHGGPPIVCLPHRLVISWAGEEAAP